MLKRKDRPDGFIKSLFLKNNGKTLLVSLLPVAAAAYYYPVVVDPLKVSLILLASLVYSVSTWLYIHEKSDFTLLTWIVCLPLVIYCAAGSTQGLPWSEAAKNANVVFYLFAYLFSIALLYRALSSFSTTPQESGQ